NKEQSDSDVQIPPEDSLEFRLLMAYTRKRRPADSRLQKNSTEQKTSTQEDNTERNKKKNKSFKKRFSWLGKCIKPKTDDPVGSNDTRQPATLCSDAESVDGVEDMANKLTEISNSVHFPESDKLESDGINSQDDALLQTIVDLLKEHGDRLNEQIMADKALSESLRASLTYGFFRRVMDAFCRSATPELPPQQAPEKTTVALICEATSKLFCVDHHPMSRVLGFGARYLQDKFPMWISRNIGNAEVEDEEEVH
ncbi:putative apoptosis facilitator Bcl-2-like protein 14, partial [Triplophysa rosa]